MCYVYRMYTFRYCKHKLMEVDFAQAMVGSNIDNMRGVNALRSASIAVGIIY